MKILDLIKPALEAGIVVGVSIFDGEYRVNLNTQAKSDCVLVERDNQIIALKRYGETEVVETFQDVLFCVDSCKHGRDYMNYMWEELINKSL